jgi:hypothetical protein
VGLNTGAGWRWPTRIWPEENWGRLIGVLKSQGLKPVILGGPEEVELNARLATATGCLWPGVKSLDTFYAMVSRCDALVTSVTQAMHLAIAAKIPLILFNNIFNKHEFELYGRGEIVGPSQACDCFYDAVCITGRNCVKEISGVNLIFSTLWSNISEEKRWVIQQSLSDFKVIKYKDHLFDVDDYNTLHKESLEFIQNALATKSNNKTIVVTHHAPTFAKYPEKYVNSKINEAFATNLTDLIQDSTIDYWIYGHHHSNIGEFQIGNTKLVTNQLGYVKYNENDGYINKAIITLL